MKPGYQLEPVIKKPLSFVSLDIASNFQFSKKKEKNKKTKAINLSQYRHSFYFIFFFMFLSPPEAFGKFSYNYTRANFRHRWLYFTDLTFSRFWRPKCKGKRNFKIRPPLCSMKNSVSSEACNEKRLSFVCLYLNMFISTNTRNPRSYEHYWTSSWNKTWKKIFRPVRDLNPWPLWYDGLFGSNVLTGSH